MTTEEIKQAVTEGVRLALSDPKIHCRYQITPEEHARQHEAMDRFIAFTAKVDTLKWGVVQKLVVALVLGLFSLLVYGAAMKLKVMGGLGWPGR